MDVVRFSTLSLSLALEKPRFTLFSIDKSQLIRYYV